MIKQVYVQTRRPRITVLHRINRLVTAPNPIPIEFATYYIVKKTKNQNQLCIYALQALYHLRYHQMHTLGNYAIAQLFKRLIVGYRKHKTIRN